MIRNKYKSETFRYGDTREQESKDRVVQFWADNYNPKYEDWYVDQEWIEHYSHDFIKRNPNRNKVHWDHEPDVAFWKWEHSEISISEQPVLKLVIEIDGKSHSSTERKLSDQMFERWIAEKYKGYVRVIRLNPVEIMGEKEDSDKYLKEKLQEFLK